MGRMQSHTWPLVFEANTRFPVFMCQAQPDHFSKSGLSHVNILPLPIVSTLL